VGNQPEVTLKTMWTVVLQTPIELWIVGRTFTRGADKPLARPGRKQATAIKLGIYSAYSPRSSINFLTRCFNFCKPLKKIRNVSAQPCLRGSNDLRVGRKMMSFQLFFFSVQRTGGSPTSPDPENRVIYQDIGSPSRPVSSGLQVPGEPGHFCARQDPPWWPKLP
jgi:hypothetical protein